MGAVIVGLREGDHKNLAALAAQRGLPVKDVAGILLEDAIRREAAQRLLESAPAPAEGGQR